MPSRQAGSALRSPDAGAFCVAIDIANRAKLHRPGASGILAGMASRPVMLLRPLVHEHGCRVTLMPCSDRCGQHEPDHHGGRRDPQTGTNEDGSDGK